jgi:hypothetical protein
MPFKPGESGNPGGRPKVLKHVQEAAREHSSDAIKVLSAIMNNAKAPAAARISAASALLDRGYGKPLQAVDSTNVNVIYAISDQPATIEEWVAEHVVEH